MSKLLKTLDVTLNTDPAANPNVTVSEDYADVTGHKVRWIQADDTEDFDFVGLSLDRAVFPAQQISGNKRRMSCSNKDDEGNYEYTITVRAKGKDWDSTPREGEGEPDGNKPVIRNR